MKPVQKVLEDGDLKVKDVDEIVLIGGSTRIPKIQQLVKEFFNGKVSVFFEILMSDYTYVSANTINGDISLNFKYHNCHVLDPPSFYFVSF